MDEKIAHRILAWYQQNKRLLPWRETSDGYKILVSEMMLQQTQVATVLNYYENFLKKFPTFESLALASQEDVLNVWQGLGYYSRARNLHKLSKIVVSEYGGKLPSELETLKSLPGIGDYIAGAVLSIAFSKPYPAVDGNVLRVVSRIDGLKEDITKQKTRKSVADILQDVIPSGDAGDFTQSMMELGAIICIPKSPKCDICPICETCVAFINNETEILPIKTKKAKAKKMNVVVFTVAFDDMILLEHRKKEGLLNNMWGLPTAESTICGEAKLKKIVSLNIYSKNPLGKVSHIFTHQHWKIDVVGYRAKDKVILDSHYKWVKVSDLEDYPIPVLFQKCLKYV